MIAVRLLFAYCSSKKGVRALFWIVSLDSRLRGNDGGDGGDGGDGCDGIDGIDGIDGMMG